MSTSVLMCFVNKIIYIFYRKFYFCLVIKRDNHLTLEIFKGRELWDKEFCMS